MGIQILSERVTLVASDDTWIEGNAIQQLHTSAKLPGMQHVVGLPDLHPGRGYPVGAAFFSARRLYPALIGGDIGCGMALWTTDLPAGKVASDKLEKRLGNIDTPLDDSWQILVDELAPAGVGHRNALGTIGGGNHFAEVQRLDEILDADAVAGLGLDVKRLLLLVHSGSRGLGRAILQEHVRAHGHGGLEEGNAECVGYLTQHEGALQFAYANRELIARRMLDRLVKRYTPAQLSKTQFGSHVVCQDKQLIYEEAPEAYKPVDSIIASLEQAGLLRVLARLRPVLTYKTRGECC